MEQKLAEYRLNKAKAKIKATGDTTAKDSETTALKRKALATPPENDEAARLRYPTGMNEVPSENVSAFTSPRSLSPTPEIDKDFDGTSVKPTSKYDRYLRLASVLLQILLWSLLMIIFVKLEFGAVFFVISLLYILWSTLRNKPKKVGEPSAYSVFNPNCERIDGTLTAEQFEREIRFQT